MRPITPPKKNLNSLASTTQPRQLLGVGGVVPLVRAQWCGALSQSERGSLAHNLTVLRTEGLGSPAGGGPSHRTRRAETCDGLD
jgi:hypothetical protein